MRGVGWIRGGCPCCACHGWFCSWSWALMRAISMFVGDGGCGRGGGVSGCCDEGGAASGV